MKIVLVSTERTGGGIASHTFTMAAQLADLGHRVMVLLPDRMANRDVGRHPVLAFPRCGDQVIFELPAPPIPFARRAFSLVGAALSYALAVRSAIGRLTERPDIVEVPEWEAAGLLLDSRLAVVTRLHGHLALIRRLDGDPLRVQDRLVAGLEALAARRATLCLASSAHLALVASRALQLAVGRVGIAPLGVDTDAFAPGSRDRARDAWQLPRDGKIALFVGRIERRKGLHDLISAWSQIALSHPEAQLVVAGTGPDREALEQSCPGLRWLGAVEPDRVASLYQASDVVCLPSPAEPFGLTTLEAMACARPVVACQGGAAPEIVRDTTGRLVPPGSPESLAVAIEEILTRPELGRKLGLAGRARIEAYFSAELSARRTLAGYEAARRAALLGEPPALWTREANTWQDRTAV